MTDDTDTRLAQIRALCDERMDAAFGMSASFLAADVLAVLDAAPVAATPAQVLDRDALTEQIAELLDVVRPAGQDWTWAHNLSLAMVALVRPVEGCVLTPEEASLALPYIERAIETYPWEDDGPLRALAARLEAG